MPKRRQSSQRWLHEHFTDPYVTRAQHEGYRSRAVYKLEEMDRRYQLLRPGMQVIDLGAAPGGWSQYARERVGEQGRVIASDVLPIEPIPGVTVIQGDFREAAVVAAMQQELSTEGVDLVLSDMAPNMSGMAAVDQPRALYLTELALDLAQQVLNPGGAFLVKLFQGSGSDAFLQSVRSQFRRVVVRKPEASRPRSREVYVLALERRDV